MNALCCVGFVLRLPYVDVSGQIQNDGQEERSKIKNSFQEREGMHNISQPPKSSFENNDEF